MRLLDRIAGRLGYAKARKQIRNYAGGEENRLTADWAAFGTSADSALEPSLLKMRFRSRTLERDNEYFQKYLSLVENNVLGANGIALQNRAGDRKADGTFVLDELANRVIKESWDEWCKAGNCEVTGRLSKREVEGMICRRTPTDGGVLVRHVRGYDNKWKYALQLIEIDQLDFYYNANLEDGGKIRFGVQMDKWGKVQGYWVFTRHPGDYSATQTTQNGQRIFITAKEMLHIFWQLRPGQTVGVPWTTGVLKALWDLGKYQEAELVAAREGACKGGAIRTPADPNAEYAPGDGPNEEIETAPGMLIRLNPGEEYQQIDPNHPNAGYGDFVKNRLRGVAAGLGVSYNALANDLESVNYSSLRAGRLDEVEEWKGIQAWLIESFHNPVFAAWLEMSLSAGVIRVGNSPLPLSKFDKFNAPDWKPRRWAFIDPQKDIRAQREAIAARLKTRSQVIAESGETDFETVIRETADENAIAKTYGVELDIDQPEATHGPVEEDAMTPPAPAKKQA